MSNVEFQSGELIFEWDSDKAALNWQNIKFTLKMPRWFLPTNTPMTKTVT